MMRPLGMRWCLVALFLLAPVWAQAAIPQVAAGDQYTVGLKSDGTVWAWGYNSEGQLGNGTTTDSTVPLQVSGLTDVVAIAAGNAHTLALQSDGTVWAWGVNSNGQLGNGTTSFYSAVPVQVSGLSDVVAIAGGGLHSLALQSDGTVWAWGYNAFGQLGNGTTTDSNVPVLVSALSDVVALAGGIVYTLALKRDGTVWAWGDNAFGQLGNGTTTDSSIPVPVGGLSDVVAIAAGIAHTLALRSNGTVWAWGNNFEGQLGNVTPTFYSAVPLQVSELTDVVALAGGDFHSLAVKRDGTVWAWGYNGLGQLGNGTTTDSTVPLQVSGLDGAVGIAAGAAHTVALKRDGTVWAWGYNVYGQLGNVTPTFYSAVPLQVVGENGIGFLNLGPAATPFATFAPQVAIAPNHLAVAATFTLGAGSNGIEPVTEGLTLQLNGYSLTIPPDAFRVNRAGVYHFAGNINNTRVVAQLRLLRDGRYSLAFKASGVNLIYLINPLTVMLTMGDDTGLATVRAKIVGRR